MNKIKFQYYLLSINKRLEQQSSASRPSYSRPNQGTYSHKKQLPVNHQEPVNSQVFQQSGFNNEPVVPDPSPRSILKKKSAYKQNEPINKPAHQPEIVRQVERTQSEVEDDRDQLKAVNVSAARKMWGNTVQKPVQEPVNRSEPVPVRKEQVQVSKPAPVKQEPAKPVNSSKIPEPVKKSSKLRKTPSTEIVDEPQLDWDEDEFDLLRGVSSQKQAPKS